MKKTVVYLVGAGPGADDLITLRGLECIRQADCLIYDRLIGRGLLDEAPEDCEKIYVGKAAGEHSANQEEINALLLEKARKGGRIVRLKGGDPYVFGRGGEEALCLREAGIPFQVVPGVTSAVAGPCFAGIPVTHRTVARSVHIVTAHTRSGGLTDEDYQRLAPLTGTLVFLMGLGQIAEIAGGLMEFGMAGTRPAAVVSCGGMPEQRTVSATLETLASEAEKADLPSPAIIVVGETVALREELNFFEELPLWNKRILVTSDSKKNGRLSRLLEAQGARVTAVPMTRIVPVEGSLEGYLPRLGDYQYVVFTSGNAVELFMKELFRAGGDPRKFGAAKICAVGPATCKKLKEYHLSADIVPPVHSGKGLLRHLETIVEPGDKVLLPQSARAKPELARGLEALCQAEVVALYDAVRLLPPSDLAVGDFDAVVFTSSLAVDNLAEGADIARLRDGGTRAFSIGPSTSAALRAQGADPLESRGSTIEELIATVTEYFMEVAADD